MMKARIVPTTARLSRPVPAAMPTVAVSQILAAVVQGRLQADLGDMIQGQRSGDVEARCTANNLQGAYLVLAKGRNRCSKVRN